jgi:hypothetical protein
VGEEVIWLRIKVGEAWMGFWVGEEVIWLRMKVDEAWEGDLGR